MPHDKVVSACLSAGSFTKSCVIRVVDNSMTAVCAGCGDPIAERTLLSALDRFWHISCLNCSYCGLRLDELGPSVFVRSNMLLCRQDYLRLFGSTGTCSKCRQKIAPDELVMRCQDNVYHVNCFICFQCQTPLHPGDKVCPINGSLFCEHEFPQLFANSPNSALKIKASHATPEHVKDASRFISNGFDGNSNGPYPVVGDAQQTDLSAILNFKPESPAAPSLSVRTCSPALVHGIRMSDPGCPPEPSNPLDKQRGITQAAVQNSDPPPSSGRKKQKKVDSRRCPTLRVC